MTSDELQEEFRAYLSTGIVIPDSKSNHSLVLEFSNTYITWLEINLAKERERDQQVISMTENFDLLNKKCEHDMEDLHLLEGWVRQCRKCGYIGTFMP